MLVADLPATRLCFMIGKEVEKIDPKLYNDATNKDIVKLALLNFYKQLQSTPDEDLNDYDLITDPNDLGNFNTCIKYKDDITAGAGKTPIYLMEDLY